MRAKPQRAWRKRAASLPSSDQMVTKTELAYAVDPDALVAGNRVRLLVDGEQAFPAMLAAIAAAETFVHLETYIFEHDRIGVKFGEALSERARAGVKVRVIIDAFGGMSLPGSFLSAMREAGVEILIYRSLIARKTFGRWTRRDHRKLMVTDGTVAFIGGINIGDEYAAVSDGGRGWRDTHVRVEGPVISHIETLFFETWHAEGGAPYRPYPRFADESVAVPGSVLAVALGSDDRGNRTAIRRAYLHAIARARNYIYIANAYFVPDRGIRRALGRAARRGVKVHVLIPEVSDLKSVQLAGSYVLEGLLRRGVRIHLWRRAMMHAKTAVIDGIWSTVGSYNLDYVSLFKNLEATLVMIGDGFGASMRDMFERDLGQSVELTLAEHRARPWWRRGLDWLLYRFRRWL